MSTPQLERYDNELHAYPPDMPAALVVLDLFESVGVRHFEFLLTATDDRRVALKSERSLDTLRNALPETLSVCTQKRFNLFARPIATPGISLIQLTDIRPSQADRLGAIAFLVLETSQGLFESWVAVKVEGIDLNSSARIRLNGIGVTRRRMPAVRLEWIAPKHVVTVSELVNAGLVEDVVRAAIESQCPHKRSSK